MKKFVSQDDAAGTSLLPSHSEDVQPDPEEEPERIPGVHYEYVPWEWVTRGLRLGFPSERELEERSRQS